MQYTWWISARLVDHTTFVLSLQTDLFIMTHDLVCCHTHTHSHVGHTEKNASLR